MSESKMTPGPWVVENCPKTDGSRVLLIFAEVNSVATINDKLRKAEANAQRHSSRAGSYRGVEELGQSVSIKFRPGLLRTGMGCGQ